MEIPENIPTEIPENLPTELLENLQNHGLILIEIWDGDNTNSVPT